MYCPFCQAEDGIRDSSSSRGLGDVYKRQEFLFTVMLTEPRTLSRSFPVIPLLLRSVSYTHLTLPTT